MWKNIRSFGLSLASGIALTYVFLVLPMKGVSSLAWYTAQVEFLKEQHDKDRDKFHEFKRQIESLESQVSLLENRMKYVFPPGKPELH